MYLCDLNFVSRREFPLDLIPNHGWHNYLWWHGEHEHFDLHNEMKIRPLSVALDFLLPSGILERFGQVSQLRSDQMVHRSLPSTSSSEWASDEYLFVFLSSFDQVITKCLSPKCWWQTRLLVTRLIDWKNLPERIWQFFLELS